MSNLFMFFLVYLYYFFFFFFSSRRRHTRCGRDWSSDVCLPIYAAGEAFDKSAKLLGLPYPGGPLIDKHAKLGNPKAFQFTAPNMPDFDYSFSGLKTNVLQFLQRNTKNDKDFVQNNIDDICASLQATIVEILFDKLIQAT